MSPGDEPRLEPLDRATGLLDRRNALEELPFQPIRPTPMAFDLTSSRILTTG